MAYKQNEGEITSPKQMGIKRAITRQLRNPAAVEMNSVYERLGCDDMESSPLCDSWGMSATDPKRKDKPAAMLDKILSGKIRKFFSEVCLVDQPWVRDDKTTLAKLRPNCKVTRFVRWEVGEEL